MYLAYYQSQWDNEKPQEFCPNPSDPTTIDALACMAFVFTAFTSFALNERITQIGRRGCYRFKNCPPYLSKCTLRLGLIINIIVLMVCWASALITIFIANSTFYMISYTVYLYFIINLDTMMMTASDYQTLDQWFKMEYGKAGEWWRYHCRARGY